MTQPVSNSLPNYTPYDPSLEQSRADGGAGGAGGIANHGTEGAGGAPQTQSPAGEDSPAQSCGSEVMKTVAACGAAYLTARVASRAAPFAFLNCLGNALDLLECASTDKAKAKAP